MIKKTLYISRDCHLSLKTCQLVVSFKDDDSERRVPIEDIGFIVIENQRVTMTCPLLASLSENNVAVVFCNKNLMPAAMLQNLDGNTIQQETFRNQLEASAPLKKNLWKQIVVAKIKNQASLIERIGGDGELIRNYANNVKSGDEDNREGAAARIYWHHLFGGDFVRDRYGDRPNQMLNYGYSVLRAAVARSLTGSGILPSLGIFHRNRYNAFPLADDIMEPFRPFVDEIVFNLVENGEMGLSRDVKAHLLEVLTCDTLYGHERRPLSVGLSLTTASLARCFAGESKKLVLPEM